MEEREELVLCAGDPLGDADTAVDKEMDLIAVSFILDDDLLGTEDPFSELVADVGKLLIRKCFKEDVIPEPRRDGNTG